ncbi:hypothetical protein F1721_23310 [Saccharopolyspora hirsuta]|uniref:Uncharacterized protein n=1 Tax=Saccharopolyspora hirsuta TaxID=1837 RepID=A0A5M7BM59_SACHI|nr:DUF6518 family protein [Saccharopolyspora hirsuta]KAA5830040.1 hypothetical protein F1721_23310 [Saccharopolyspora hirsuta]
MVDVGGRRRSLVYFGISLVFMILLGVVSKFADLDQVTVIGPLFSYGGIFAAAFIIIGMFAPTAGAAAAMSLPGVAALLCAYHVTGALLDYSGSLGRLVVWLLAGAVAAPLLAWSGWALRYGHNGRQVAGGFAFGVLLADACYVLLHAFNENSMFGAGFDAFVVAVLAVRIKPKLSPGSIAVCAVMMVCGALAAVFPWSGRVVAELVSLFA